ncbi:hypothetical protein HMPREF9120_00873 [Neisseria sp. oral taxon 020 str. F0370]|nr:hypothetical protein HMPREF9120_00873 [Neisseria sp. oral taxon 020 str. F0370]
MSISSSAVFNISSFTIGFLNFAGRITESDSRLPNGRGRLKPKRRSENVGFSVQAASE